jgi:hypothetical protein
MSTNDISEKLQKKLNQDREFRDMEVRAIESENSDEMAVEGYATTFNDPYLLWSEPGYRVYEQIDRDAFTGCDMSDVIMQYNHEGRVFARMSNGTLTATPDEHGLLTRAILSGTEIGRQLYQEIKGGYTNKMSFGFTVAEDIRDIQENKETDTVTITRTIKRIGKLYDVSAVSLPANPGTNIAARSYGEGVIAEVKAERQRAAEEEAKRQKLISEIRKSLRKE